MVCQGAEPGAESSCEDEGVEHEGHALRGLMGAEAYQWPCPRSQPKPDAWSDIGVGREVNHG